MDPWAGNALLDPVSRMDVFLSAFDDIPDQGREKTDQGSGTRACPQRPRIGRNRSASGSQKKGISDLGGRRGRMISTPDRETAVALINDAVTTGARRAKACAELEISDRTLRRWTKDGQLHADQRPLAPRPEPANKLSAAERAAVLEACNSTEFASLPPCQIVPKLADPGRYLASGSSFYRMPGVPMDSNITVAGPSPRFGANHPPATRQVRPARSGPGT